MKLHKIVAIALMSLMVGATPAIALADSDFNMVTEESDIDIGADNDFEDSGIFRLEQSENYPDETYWKAYDENGKLIRNKIIKYNDESYGINGYGYVITTGWMPTKTGWHYFDDEGHMYRQTGDEIEFQEVRVTQVIERAFDKDGNMLYGWVTDEGKRVQGEDAYKKASYYLGTKDDGAKKTGLLEVDGKLFYFIDGRKQTSTTVSKTDKDGNTDYYIVDEYGVAHKQ